MRTTLSIDDDVAALLKKEIHRSGDPLKTTVNRILRIGLMAAQHQKPLEPFVVAPFDLSLPPGLNQDNIEELLDALEGPARR